MIHIHSYKPDRDYETIALWWQAHGLDPIPLEFLPAVGFVVSQVCAGFLYQTDTDLALIEGLVSNPETPAQLRDEALDAVVEALCSEAKKLGYLAISGFTQVPKVVSRAKRHGFKPGQGSYRLVTRRL